MWQIFAFRRKCEATPSRKTLPACTSHLEEALVVTSLTKQMVLEHFSCTTCGLWLQACNRRS